MSKTALALAALVLAGTATASSTPVFKWSSSDLATLEGITRTHERVETAARQFCRQHLRGTQELRRSVRCVSEVMDEIVASVDDPRLTAYAATGSVSEDLLARR